MTKRARVVVSGRVQGVFFRAECERRARELGVAGYVRNLRDGGVEAAFEGPDQAVQHLLDWSRHGPDGRFDLVVRRCDGSGQPAWTVPPAADPLPWAAYVNGVARRRARALLPALRAGLSRRLPDYMVPSAYVLLDALPLSPNGKVDRTALPAPDSSRRATAATYLAPRNAVEQVLAGIWAEILGLDRVGVLDDFFALGGHSLLSTRVVARIRDAFQVDLPLHRVFSEPTVAGLAEALLGGGRREVVERTAELVIKLSTLSDEQVAQALGSSGPAGEEHR